MPDSTEKRIDLYNIKANYTVIVFWDPTQKEAINDLLQLDSIYNSKWRAKGLKVYSVNIKDSTSSEYKNIITSNKLSSEWYYTHFQNSDNVSEPRINKLFELNILPSIYLLNDEKVILAKGLSLLKFDELITAIEFKNR